MSLRPLEESDQEEFARAMDVSRIAWAPWMPATQVASSPVETFRRELDRVTRGGEAGTHIRLAGFLENGRLAGLFSLNEIVRGVFESAHAGWAVTADVVGRGLGTEGVQALLAIAFGESPNGVGLHRVQANIMPSNGASLRIAEKVGFRREGFAERYLKIAGAWEDHVMFAITSEEHASSS